MADAKIVLSAVDQTKAALDSAKRNLSSLGEQAGRIDARFGAVGAAIAGAFTAATFKGAVDMLDKLDDLSEKTGISVESLSALRYAGEVTGTSLEALATGTRKLAVNMADAAGGGKETAATSKALGVAIRDSNGALRSQDAVLLDLADRFKSYADGPEKAALAIRVFGKTGEEMIPLLNQGSDGIKRLRGEAERLGLVFGSDVAKAAAAFNDNLTKLSLSSEALKVELAGGLLPAVNRLIEGFLRLKQAGQVWTILKDAAKGVVGLNRLSDDPGADIKSLMRDRDRTQRSLDFAKRKGYATDGFQDELFQIEQLLEASRIRQAGRVLSDGAEYGDQISRRLGGRGGKTAAPIVQDGSAAAKANKELAEQAKLLAELAGLSGSFAEDWDRLSTIYAKGGLTLEQLTKAQADLLAKQPAIHAQAEAQAKAEKEASEARDARAKELTNYIDSLVQQRERQAESNQALRDEIAEMGLTIEQLGALRAARLSEVIARREQELAAARAAQASESELYYLEEQIRLLRERRSLEGDRAQAEVRQQQIEEGKKRTQAIGDSIEEGVLNGFRGGQSIATIFLRELKGQFAKTVLRPQIDFVAKGLNQLLEQILGTGKGGGISGLPGGLGGLLGGGGGALQAAFSQTALGSSGFGTGLAYGNLDLGGFFADGGRPPLGRVSVVGERGPELFVPDSAGTIVPNHKLGGGQTIVNHFTFGEVPSKKFVMDAVRQGQRQSAAQFSRSTNYGGDV